MNWKHSWLRAIGLVFCVMGPIGAMVSAAPCSAQISKTQPSGRGQRDEAEAVRQLRLRQEQALQEQMRLVREHRAKQDELRKEWMGDSFCLAGTDTAYGSLKVLYAQFIEGRPDTPQNFYYTGGGDEIGIRELLAGRCEAALVREPLTPKQVESLAKAFPDPKKQPREVVYGKAAVIVVVHRDNRVPSLTYDQIESLFRAQTTAWYKVEGNGSSVDRMGTTYPALSWGMFTRQVLKNKPIIRRLLPPQTQPADKHAVGDATVTEQKRWGPFPFYQHDAQVLAEVAKNPNAIGYCSLPPGGLKTRDVRVVPVVGPSGGPAVAASVESVFGEDYPLQSTLRFIVRPDASELTQAFVEYATSDEAAATIRGVGLHPLADGRRALAIKRLAEMKKGSGDRIMAAGAKDLTKWMEDTNVEYVMTKAVALVNFSEVSQVSAIGSVTVPVSTGSLGTEIAFVEGNLSAETLKVHGQRLKEVSPEHLDLGARGTAIIVHSLNKLDSLTLDQVKAIFGGKLDDWRLLEASQSNLPIRRYGPGKYDPAANIFYEKVLSWSDCKNINRKDTAAEIIAAVGADTQGIAFVSVTDVMDYMQKLQEQLRDAVKNSNAAMLASYQKDAAGQPIIKPSIKVLAIGPKESPIAPDRKTVNDGSYLLSSPLTLYISPKARDAAKKFAEFCVTRQVHPVLLKHGIVPSFTADEQERQLAAAKRTAEEEAKFAAERARWEAMFTEPKLSDDFQAGVGQWDDTSGFARADLGGGKFAFQAQPGKAAARAVNRQPVPGAFQLDMDVQVKFGKASSQNAFALHFGRKPAISGTNFSWGTGYSLAVVDDVANDGLRLSRPELNDKGRIAKPSVQIGQTVTAVDDKPHHVRVISEGDGKIHIFYDDMSRPAITIDDGEKFQGGDGTFLGVSAGAGTGATVNNVTLKAKKATP